MIGDRILWISGTEAQDKPPTQAIVEFRDNALAFGERREHSDDLAWFLSFGAPLESSASERVVSLGRAGLNEVRKLGVPRAIADIGSGWRIRMGESPPSDKPDVEPGVQVADPKRVRKVLARAKRVLRLLTSPGALRNMPSPSKRIH